MEERYAVELLSGQTSGVGYLLKQREVADVRDFDALERVRNGGGLDPEWSSSPAPRGAPSAPAGRGSRLASTKGPRAHGRGVSNAGIARRLVVTEGAVEKHVTSIFAKLGLEPAETDHRRVLAVLRYLEDR